MTHSAENAERPYFAADGLAVGYDGDALIERIAFTLDSGDVLTLIGPNGAGKSTILKTIARHLKPLAGQVRLGERALVDLSSRELARELAVVLTDRLRTEMLTCQDIVETGRYPYTGSMGLLDEDDRATVERYMKLTSTWEIRDRDFMRISDGQKQRVLLARALCQEPRVILLDEPTSFLDVRYQVELLGILRTMAKKNRIAVIMSLHELDMAQKISDYILCVKGDRIFRFGTPEDIFTRDTIKELYDLDEGSYDPLFGSVELARSNEPARVFVIAGGGTGIPAFRALQKRGVGFSTGVLHRGDVDWALANDLASEVIEERPFEPIGNEAITRAKRSLERCDAVLCTLEGYGTMNRGNAQLEQHARESGIPVVRSVGDLPFAR